MSQGQRISVAFGQGKSAQLAAKVRKSGDKWLLCIHGWGCAKECFEGIFARGEFDDWSICTIDLLGFGQSDRPKDFSYSLEDQAALMSQVVAHFGMRNVAVVGHSMGGGVGLLAAPLLGQRLRNFVSVEGSLGVPNGGLSSVFVRLPFWTARFFVVPLIKAGAACSFSRTNRQVGNWLRHADSSAMYRAAKSLTLHAQGNDLLEQFARLPPKAYMCGEQSGRLRSVVPHLEKLGIKPVVVKSAGHVMMIDNPNGFYAALAAAI